jgi:hypothetical protein
LTDNPDEKGVELICESVERSGNTVAEAISEGLSDLASAIERNGTGG